MNITPALFSVCHRGEQSHIATWELTIGEEERVYGVYDA